MSKRKHNIQFTKPDEPDFIKKLKQRAGLTVGPDIETKSESLPIAEKKDFEDRDEEQPVVVQLKSGDLSEEEVKQFKEILKSKEEDEDLNNGKIIFKKPDKSLTEDKKKIMIQSSISDKIKSDSNIKLKSDTNNSKSVSNKSLLSFGDEEEEEYSD